jgi:hypothetical protein
MRGPIERGSVAAGPAVGPGGSRGGTRGALWHANVGDCTWLDVDPELFEDVTKLVELLNKLRRGFGDFATLDYPWSPADD